MDLSAYRQIQQKNLTDDQLKKDLEYAKKIDAGGLKAPNKIPIPRVQSTNPPAAKAQQGNALDLAKAAIANQQTPKGIGFANKQQYPSLGTMPKVNAIPMAQKIQQKSQGLTPQQVQQKNLQIMKLGTLPKSNVEQVGIGFKQPTAQPTTPIKTSMPAPAADTLQRAKQIPTRAGDSNAMYYAKAVKSGLGNAAAGLQNTYQMGKMEDAAKLNGEKTDFVNPFANMNGKQSVGDSIATLANNLATNFTAALDRNPGTILRRWLTNNLVYTDEQAKEQGYANKEAMVEDVARKAMEATSWNDAIQQDFANQSQNKSLTQRYAANIMQNIAQMAPQIATNLVVPGSGMPMMAAQVYGNSAMEALDNGATLQQASNRGALSAATEVGTEKLFGGIPGLEEGLIKLGRVGNMLGEGVEEGISTALSGAIDRATYDPTAENATAGDIARDALMGAAVSGVMQIPGMVTDIATDLNSIAAIKGKIEENNREFGNIDSVTMWSDENYRSNPDREKAKNGDEQAAKRLVDKLVTPEFAEMVKQKYPNAVIVPVVDFERTETSNVLPDVFASKLSGMTGLTLTHKIGKMNTTDRAHAKNALERLMQRAEFRGEVIPGKQYYLMADDFVSTGFTLADLKRYIESKGGKVVGAVTLAATNEESLRLEPTVEELERLKGYDRTVLENILRSYQISDNIEALSRAEVQKIAAVLAKGKRGGYKGDELYNRLRAALDAAKRSGNEKIVSKRQNNLLNKTTANNGGFSMPDSFDQNTVGATVKTQNAAENTKRPASLRQRAGFATDMESRTESAKNAEGAVADMLRDEDAGMLETEAGDLSDIAEALNGHGTYMNLDIYRVLDKVSGKNQELRQRLHEAIEKPLNDAKAKYAQNIVQRMNDYKAQMDRLGIKIGSKESAAVQWYGEGQRQVGKNGATEPYELGQLQEEFPNTWENIVEAERIHRQIYDDYVDRINQALAEIYPEVEANANTELAKKQEAFELAKERMQLQQELVQGLVEQANQLKAQAKSLDLVEGNKARQELAKVKAQMKKEGNTLKRREKAMQKAAEAYNKLNAEIESGSYFRNKRLMPRKDYFHHFVEMEEGLGGLKNILSRPSDIAPNLVGTSDNTKPKSKFWGALQRRTGAAYTEDAIAGMARYIPAAEYKINIDPVTAQLRGTVKSLVDSTQQTRNANGFIEFLTDYANDLAGKTNPLDRGVQKVFGRKAMKTLEWVNNRVKANAVVGNLGSAVVQIGNIPNATTYVQNPVTWAKAAATLANPEKANLLLAQSPFLTERFMGSTTGMFDQKNVLQKGSEWVLEIGDKKASELIWLAAYNQYNDSNGNVQGPRQYDNAIDYADDVTRRSVAGRGVGEIPLTQKSRLVKLLAPFQVEVNNAYNLMKEQIGAKNAKGLIAYCASAWLTNALIEAVAGKRPIFDPIQALLDAIKLAQGDDEEKGDLGAAAKRLAGEAASNVPGISTFAPLFVDVDDMVKVFGEDDPTRYGTGMSATQEAFSQLGNLMSGKPVDVLGLATTYVTPFGGQQLERMVKAGQNFGYIPKVTQTEEETQLKRQEVVGSYNDSGKLRFAMEPTAKNFAINAAFGEYATPEGREYLENGSIMSAKNTDIINRAPKEALLTAPTAQQIIQGMKGQTNGEKLQYIQSQNNLTAYQKAWLQHELVASDKVKEKAQLARTRGIPLSTYYFVVNNGGSQEKTTAALNRCPNLSTSQKYWMWQTLTGGAEKNNPYK